MHNLTQKTFINTSFQISSILQYLHATYNCSTPNKPRKDICEINMPPNLYKVFKTKLKTIFWHFLPIVSIPSVFPRRSFKHARSLQLT